MQTEGLALLFEASAIAPTLVGEPMLVVLAGVVSQILFPYTNESVLLGERLFFIFFGALWIALCANAFKWKTKGKNLIYNFLEAFSVIGFTCFFLPRYTHQAVRLGGALVLYVLVTQKVVPSIIILLFHSLIYIALLYEIIPLVLLVYVTFFLLVVAWVYDRLK